MKKLKYRLSGMLALLLSALLLFTGCTDSDLDKTLSLAEQLTQEQTQTDSGSTAAPSESEDTTADADVSQSTAQTAETETLSESGTYTTPDDVAAYLNTYAHLPDNFITKKAAQALGWDSKAGNLQDVAPGKSIGGDYFGNYEGLLPAADGREYHECDVNYTGGYRGAERIIYSNDGLIYYTNDHYETFTLLYGEE